ncbi:Intramolecular chaperone auto-processing domain containing protein [uncultured Caudovirales phage]|uniref:Intramolecular chaperone auto-processing domain containing protein n=1 Tax=uncultured Caudovirales phage TaxID=2100421 RepID=A0A6J5PVG4_9CAUD|nr:Intramolecular chaperone auto-processing domain containing protein [uncultured Caudovirales phage]
MASIISAGTTSGTALNMSGDTSGVLQLATNGTTTAMTIDTSQNVGIGTTSPSTRLSLQLSSATTYTTSTRTNQGLTIYNSSATTNGFTGIEFVGEPTSGNGGIAGIGSVVTASGSANLVFGTRDSATYTEKMRIDSSGRLLVGITSTRSNGGVLQVSAQGQTGVVTYTTSTTNNNAAYFENGNGIVGTIATNGSATAYNTSSDYRLKENIAPMTGALAKVAQLKPVTYKWKVDGSDGEGFIAHELAEVKPDCVSGNKDAIDADGNPVYQGIDVSFLVATLTAAIQELKAINDTQAATITALTARIVALEGK